MTRQSLSRPIAEHLVAQEEVVDGVVRRRSILKPDATRWDPFILWGDDIFEKDAFTMHPHRGFETVTYIIDGTLDHRDSHGGSGTLRPGDVEWTTAGAGIMHEEQPREGQVWAVQLWLNLPAAYKMVAPRYQELRGDVAPTIGAPGFIGRVFGGTINGVTGPALQYNPATFADFIFTEGELDVTIAADQMLCLFVFDGELLVNGETVREGTAIRCDPDEGVLHLRAQAPGRAVLCAGKPLREPVVWDGPFVMNTPEEIRQAYHDLEAGLFAAP